MIAAVPARVNDGVQRTCLAPAETGEVKETPAAVALRDTGWSAGLFVVALVVRLAHLWTIRETPFFTDLGLDPLAYDEWGRRIAGGEWLGDQIFYQDPLYPYLLGAVYRVAGHNLTVAVALQCLLGSLVAPFVHRASRHWFGRREAIVAGLLAALYAPAIYYDGLLLKTGLGAFLVSASLLAISAALRRRSSLRWMSAGALLGLGCLVRGNLLFFLPVLAAWLVLHREGGSPATPGPSFWPALVRRLRGWPDWQNATVLMAGAALVLLPTAVRNRVVGGEWVLTTAQAGPNFYIGNNPINTSGRYEALPFAGANPKYERPGFTREAERRTGRPLSATEVSRFWFGEAWRWIRSHPADWLLLTWRKFRTFWGAYEVPDNLDYYLYRKSAPLLRLPLPGFGLVAPLGLLGIWIARRNGAWPGLLTLFVLLYSTSVVLFFVFSRYRLPMLPALYPLAGVAAVDLGRRLRSALRGETGPAPFIRRAAVAAVLFAFVNLPVHALADSPAFAIARALGLPRQVETSAAGHFNLGLSYAHRADETEDRTSLLEKAVEAFRAAARQDPRSAAPFGEMGKALARLGRDAEAIEAYRTVIRLDPDRPRPHHVLGLLYRRTGDLDAAERSFRRALQLAPERVDSAVALGEVQLQRGDRRGAAVAFRHALKVDPQHPGAREGLRAATGRP